MAEIAFRGLRLSSIIEGVEASVSVRGADLRVVVTAEALQTRFEADCEPGAWLRAFQENMEVIGQAVNEAHKPGKSLLVLQTIPPER